MNDNILYVEWKFGNEQEIYDIDLSQDYTEIKTTGRMLPYGSSVCVALQIWSTLVRAIYKVRYCAPDISRNIDDYNKALHREFAAALASGTSWALKQNGIWLLLQCGTRHVSIIDGKLDELSIESKSEGIPTDIVIIPQNADILGFVNVNPYKYLDDLDSVLRDYGSMLCHALTLSRFRDDNHEVCVGEGLSYEFIISDTRRIIIDTGHGKLPLDQSNLYLRTLAPLMIILQQKLITNSVVVFNMNTRVIGDQLCWLLDILRKYAADNKCKLIIIEDAM